MRYESKLKEVEASPEKRQKLIQEYDEICKRLCEELVEQHPDIYDKLLGLTRKISDYVLRNSTNSKKGMGELMGGKVLELETDWFDDAVREARIQGRKSGKDEERNSLVLAMLFNGMSVEEVSKMCNLPLEEVRRIEKS